MSPLMELTKARLRETWREPAIMFWVFGFPILLAIALGIAFRDQDPEPARAAVIAAPGDPVVAALATSADLVVAQVEPAEAMDQLARAKVDLVLDLTVEPLRYTYDAKRAESRFARLVVDRAVQRALGRQDARATEDRGIEERGRRYIDFLVPGLIGLNLMGSSLWGVGYAIVVARKRRLMKRLAASPMRRIHLLLSYLLSRLVFLVAEVIALVVAGWLIFDVAVQGSLLALGLVTMMGATAFGGLALLVGARIENTEVANGWMNFIQMPMLLLSGTFFSYERFPAVLHPVIELLPLTPLIGALRAIFNEGAGVLDVAPALGALGLWAALSSLLALRLFRWQ
jgi:ABC-2 type transport system permease protein